MKNLIPLFGTIAILFLLYVFSGMIDASAETSGGNITPVRIAQPAS